MLFFLGCDKKKILDCLMNNMLLYVCLYWKILTKYSLYVLEKCELEIACK